MSVIKHMRSSSKAFLFSDLERRKLQQQLARIKKEKKILKLKGEK
jgi:hypothetical protein